MGYRLKASERFSKRVKRIVLEQIDKALDNLKPTVKIRMRQYMTLVVSIKNIRAMLRLPSDSQPPTYTTHLRTF